MANKTENNIIMRFRAVMDGAWNGVKNAMSSIGSVAGKVATGMVQQFSKVSHLIGGELSTAIDSFGGVLKGILSGGVIGGMMAGVNAAISAYAKHVEEECKRVSDAAKEMSESVARYTASVITKLHKSIDALKGLMTAQKDAAADRDRASAREMSARGHNAAMTQLENQINQATGRLSGKDNVALAEERLAQVTQEQTEKRENALRAEELAVAEAKKAREDLAKAEISASKLQEDANNYAEGAAIARANGSTELADKLEKESAAARSAYEASMKEARVRLENAELKAQEAKQAREQIEASAKLADLTAQQKLQDERKRASDEAAAKQAADARAAQEAAAKAAAKAKADADAELKRTVQARAREEKKSTEALRESTKEQSAAQSKLNDAQRKLAEAWSWYRNQDALKAQLEEEKANSLAEKQFEKDFARLRSRRSDWRTVDGSKLSLNEEAVRRVGMAREERDKAAEKLSAIEQHTAELAAKLDELLAVKEGG